MQHSVAWSSSLLEISYVLGPIFVKHASFLLSLVHLEVPFVLHRIGRRSPLEPPFFSVPVSSVIFPVSIILVIFTLVEERPFPFSFSFFEVSYEGEFFADFHSFSILEPLSESPFVLHPVSSLPSPLSLVLSIFEESKVDLVCSQQYSVAWSTIHFTEEKNEAVGSHNQDPPIMATCGT